VPTLRHPAAENRPISGFLAASCESRVKHVGRDGQCDPSHATLASEVQCGQRTVRRAINTMKNLGLLLWQTRIVRAGWRTEQTSSAYEFTPTAAVMVLPRCGGQSGRETKTSIYRGLTYLPSAHEAKAAQERLASIAVGRMRVLGLG
jgi:hypothetical protein